MAERLPNTFVPSDVRRTLGRLRLDSDEHDDEITVIEADIVTIEADVAAIDTRVDALEDISPGSYEGEALEDVAEGLPVYGSAGITSVGLARADTVAKARVAGLAKAAALTGFTVTYQASGRMELADWTAVTGAATLTPSATYYLDETGGLTAVAPTTVGQTATEVGQAIEGAILHLNIKRPVLL